MLRWKAVAPGFHLAVPYWHTEPPGLLLRMLLEEQRLVMPAAMALSPFLALNHNELVSHLHTLPLCQCKRHEVMLRAATFVMGHVFLHLILKVLGWLPVETVAAASATSPRSTLERQWAMFLSAALLKLVECRWCC